MLAPAFASDHHAVERVRGLGALAPRGEAPVRRHEMLNETNRDDVMNAVAAFLDRALK